MKKTWYIYTVKCYTVGEGEGGMIWESSIETYTLPYIIQTASGNLLYDMENPKRVLCKNLEVWDGREEGGMFKNQGTCINLWLIHVDVWHKSTRHCKIIILQLKIKWKNKFKTMQMKSKNEKCLSGWKLYLIK